MLQLSALRREFRARRLLKAQIVSAGGGQRQCVREGGGRGAARACPTDGHTLVCRLQRQSFSGRLVACPGPRNQRVCTSATACKASSPGLPLGLLSLHSSPLVDPTHVAPAWWQAPSCSTLLGLRRAPTAAREPSPTVLTLALSPSLPGLGFLARSPSSAGMRACET